MDLKQIQYFVQIARSRSFNRAASHLYIAQSALSRQIRLLEEELGISLLVRHARGVNLTPAGELLLERSEALLRFSRQLRDEVAALGSEPRGEVVIGLPPSLNDSLSVPLLIGMARRYPHIRLTTWVGTSMMLKELVDAGAVDIAVIGALERDANVAMQPLFRDELYLVGAADSEQPTGPTSCAQLKDLPLILTSRPNSVRRLADAAAAKLGFELNVVMEINYLPLIVELVRQRVGQTLLPLPAVEQLVNREILRATRITGLSYEWAVVLPKDNPGSVGTRCVQNLLQELVTAREISARNVRSKPVRMRSRYKRVALP
jgi:LysR family transcriptional regulator, nitrogen assimilation regulatory protein